MTRTTGDSAPQDAGTTDVYARRVAAGDWPQITGELNEYGGALLPRLLDFEEASELRDLYDDDSLFRSTINMGRHRFGEGEYRYFSSPYPKPVEQLKQALYPRLLPIARDWWTKLGRETIWPDTPSTPGSSCATRLVKRSRPRSC